ncbi:MAG: diguanylate cyclase [Burkholderiaceae bacterium]
MANPPTQEGRRLAALYREELLDTEAEAVLDGLTRVAAEVCGAPIALISLVDKDRQWFKSAVGLPQGDQTPREHAFCAHAIVNPDDLFEIPDAKADPRFVDNPLVTGAPHIRAYAGVPIKAPDGSALGTLCVLQRQAGSLSAVQSASLTSLADVVTRLLRERSLHRAAKERLTTIYIETPALLYLLNAQGEIIEVSDMWLNHFGYESEQVLGRNARELMTTRAREAFMLERDRLWAEGGCRDFPCQFTKADGQVVDVLMSADIELDSAGDPSQVRCVLVDVTHQLMLQSELEYQARIDDMTGLANRAWFMQNMRVELDRSKRHARPLSLIMFDIDHFKQMNDQYGHLVGDRALIAIAEQAREQLRVSDQIGRIGGEEFAILLPETDASGALLLAERLRQRLESMDSSAYKLPCQVTASFGVALVDPQLSVDTALKNADMAMYAAKRDGRNRVVLWKDHRIVMTGRRLSLPAADQAALDHVIDDAMRAMSEGLVDLDLVI